jgi:hypothetical protein
LAAASEVCLAETLFTQQLVLLRGFQRQHWPTTMGQPILLEQVTKVAEILAFEATALATTVFLEVIQSKKRI